MIWVLNCHPLFQSELSLVSTFFFPFPRLYHVFVLFVIPLLFNVKLLHLQSNSSVYLRFGHDSSPFPPSRVLHRWTLNSVLIAVFSCLYAGPWLCSPWNFVSSCSLTKSLFCAAQLSSSLFSLWLQPLNHKYSPAGNQTRADMNPEAQQDVSVSQKIRMMFYMMKPNETSFQTLEEVPDYVKQVRLSGKRLLLLFS